MLPHTSDHQLLIQLGRVSRATIYFASPLRVGTESAADRPEHEIATLEQRSCTNRARKQSTRYSEKDLNGSCQLIRQMRQRKQPCVSPASADHRTTSAQA